VSVYNNIDTHVIPSITYTDLNNVSIDMTGLVSDGPWNVRISL
jgi:hypothetical protein